MGMVKCYHGSSEHISNFDISYSGDNTANNDHDCFFFSDQYEVAKGYGRQAIIRRYEDLNLVELLEIEDLGAMASQAIIEDIHEYAEQALNVVTVSLTFNNPYILDMNYATINCTEIQQIIGHLKGKEFHEETHCKILDTLECECECECECELPTYDGLIIKNCIDDIGDLSCIYQTEYVAFYDYQIDIIHQIK